MILKPYSAIDRGGATEPRAIGQELARLVEYQKELQKEIARVNGVASAPETDPVFGASPAGGITAEDIAAWDAASGEDHDAVTLDAAADTVLSLTGQVLGLDAKAANTVLAGPETGAAAAPTMRALVDADIPAAIARDTEVSGAISTHAAIATAHHTNANDPSAGEKAALAGTSGTPGAENKYVTNGDARNSDARTPAAHVLVSASHTTSGLTAGHFLKALTETTFGFAAHGLGYSDVGAAASGHNHDSAYLGIAAKAADADKLDGVGSIGYATSGHGHSHTALTDIGTNTHAQVDTFISSKGAASGLASLDGSSKVVQDPANATATPTQNKIPIADGVGGTLGLGWLPATLTGKTATPAAHALTNAVHAETGLTAGHFLKATSATAFGFGAHGLAYSDVGAAAASHAHAIGDLPTAATVTDGDDTHVPTNHAVYTAIQVMGGVTGGDAHDHVGGDGAQIDHGGLGGLSDDDHTQYIKHALATAASDFLVASGAGAFVKKTLAETLTILGKNVASGIAPLDASSLVPDANLKPYRLWESDGGAAALSVDTAGAVTAVGTLTFGSVASTLNVGPYGVEANINPAGDVFSLYDGTAAAQSIRIWYAGTSYLTLKAPTTGASSAATISTAGAGTHINILPASGFVGINTAAPTVALDVTGAAKISSTLAAGATTLSGALAMGANAITSTGTLSAGATTLSGALAMGVNAITTTGAVSTGNLTPRASAEGGTPLNISTASATFGTGNDISLLHYQDALKTTNATPQTILTIPIPTNSACTIDAILTVTGNLAPTHAQAIRKIALFRNNAGFVELCGGVTEIYNILGDISCSATITFSGTNALVMVTGETGTDFHWACTATRHITYIPT